MTPRAGGGEAGVLGAGELQGEGPVVGFTWPRCRGGGRGGVVEGEAEGCVEGPRGAPAALVKEEVRDPRVGVRGREGGFFVDPAGFLPRWCRGAEVEAVTYGCGVLDEVFPGAGDGLRGVDCAEGGDFLVRCVAGQGEEDEFG